MSPQGLLELLEVLDGVSALPLGALPFPGRHPPVAGEASPIGLGELPPQRVVEGLVGGVGVRLPVAGAIHGYRAGIDPQALGLFVTALVSVMPLDPKQADDLPDRVRELPEVEDCHSVAGDENYILKVRTGTTSDLEDFLRRLREKAGVQTRTTVVLSTPFEHRPIAP